MLTELIQEESTYVLEDVKIYFNINLNHADKKVKESS